jgi:hypothetical protein
MELVIYIKYQFVKEEKICVTVYSDRQTLCHPGIESRDVDSI